MAYTIKQVDDLYLIESDRDKTNRLIIDMRDGDTFVGIEFKNEFDEYIYSEKRLERTVEKGTYNMFLEEVEANVLFTTKDLPSALVELAYIIERDVEYGKSI